MIFFFCVFVSRAVRTRQAHVDPIHGGRRCDDDADLVPVHTERAVFPVGGLLNRVHRTGRGRLHGPVGRQPGHDIDGEPDHVHRVLGGLHRAHMLRVHVVRGHASRGTGPREPVRAGPADHPGRGQHGAGRVGPDTGRQLHIHGVLQDDLPGDRVRRPARHDPAAGAPVAVRSGRVLRRRPVVAESSPPVHRRSGRVQQVVGAAAASRRLQQQWRRWPRTVLHTAPVAVAAGLWRGGQAVPRGQAVRRQPEAGQGHGPGHVGGVEREQFVEVATAPA